MINYYYFRVWRWYSEEVLHCSSKEMLKKGLNLEQLTLLARCNGLHTLTLRPINLNVEGAKCELIDPDKMHHLCKGDFNGGCSSEA